jgi:spermidine synthase
MNSPRRMILSMCMFAFGVTGAVSTAAEQLGEVIYKKNSLYNSIFIYQSGSIVSMKFGRQAGVHLQSQVDLDNPQQHLLEYTRMTFCGLLYKPEPKTMLVLGLGGGVIPSQMRHYFPSMEIDVAEIDADVVPAATKFMGFKEDEKLKVTVDDGRMFIKKQLRRKPVPKYDMIILDAFNGDYIPFHLMTKEFLEEVKGVLADDGVVIANVFFTNRLFDAEFKTFISVFGRSQAFYGRHSGNAMIVSPGAKCEILTLEKAVENARQLRQKLNLSFDVSAVAGMLRPNAQPEKKAKALTDDLAPVNWLKEQETEELSEKTNP